MCVCGGGGGGVRVYYVVVLVCRILAHGDGVATTTGAGVGAATPAMQPKSLKCEE